MAGARVIAVAAPEPDAEGRLVTFAVSRDQVLALAQARADAETLLVTRLSPTEAGR